MKKIIATALALALTLSLVACGASSTESNSTSEKVTVRLLGYASIESSINITRDQLEKAGFNVVIDMQPDYSSYTTAQATGNYDLALTGWTTVTGNPDYAVNDIFTTGGVYNRQGLSDETVDNLIKKAASETPAEYIATYTELENYLVKENAYIVPLYSSSRIQAINSTLLDLDTIRQPKSRSGVWEKYSYIDTSLNATRTLVLTQATATLTSLDPIQANDGSINQLSSNINIRIMNLTDEDEVTAEGSLALNYAIAQGNSEYYFVLRDDVYFSKVENKQVVGTGVRVGAEDVVFTLNRAKDPNSVISHKTYGLHQYMQEIEIVTDLNELSTVLDSDTGLPVLETLEAGIGSISELTSDKTAVDNAAGTYQVVKITTTEPFPQVLNYLAHQSAGILSEEQVTSINSLFNVETYDAQKDVSYGDFNAIKTGNNHLWMSGPYALVSVDDYSVDFQKNPGYMIGTEHEANIENISFKFIADETSAVNAFRSGEIDFLPAVPTTSVATLQENSDFTVMIRTSNGVSYAVFNLTGSSLFSDKNLRLAVLNAIDQNDFVLYNSGLVNPTYSTLSTLIDTGNVLVQDLEASAEYLAAYQN